jgi:hypothetical protein
VAPFRSDGTTPNVFLPPPEETDFLIVKRSIASDDQVENFLKRLGLSEPDIFDEIVERVLPKYKKRDVSSIPQHEHKVDIQKILRAVGSDSEAGKKKVAQAARQTPFLKAIDQNNEGAFKRPIDIYFSTQELKDYFFGCPDVWFLDETDGKDEWREFGVENKPRFNKIRIDLSWDERSSLVGNQGHTRDIETIDYELDGIDNFLSRFSEGIQQLKQYSLIVWNFLLQHLKECSFTDSMRANISGFITRRGQPVLKQLGRNDFVAMHGFLRMTVLLHIGQARLALTTFLSNLNITRDWLICLG